MKKLIIENLKNLESQFDGTYSELKTAEEIVDEIKKKLQTEKLDLSFIFIDCNKKSDAFCTFKLIKKLADKVIYEYQGTAN